MSSPTSVESRPRKPLGNKYMRQITRAISGLKKREHESQAEYWSALHVVVWIDIIGLGMYKENFLENGVDGSTLLELRREQFERCLGFTNPLHQLSLRYALADLKSMDIDYTNWQWSCNGVLKWLEKLGFSILIERFSEAAVHGGVLFRLTKSELATKLSVGVDGESELVLESLWYAIQHVRRQHLHTSDEDEDYRDWGPNQIKEWLESIHLGHLFEVFAAHCVNGTLLPILDPARLRRIMNLTEIQTIVVMKAIKRLTRNYKTHVGKENVSAQPVAACSASSVIVLAEHQDEQKIIDSNDEVLVECKAF